MSWLTLLYVVALLGLACFIGVRVAIASGAALLAYCFLGAAKAALVWVGLLVLFYGAGTVFSFIGMLLFVGADYCRALWKWPAEWWRGVKRRHPWISKI